MPGGLPGLFTTESDMKRKPDIAYYVHWIIAIAVVSGVLGAIIQFIRFGTIVESGDIGPTGF